MKLERKALTHYIDSTFKTGDTTTNTPDWFLLGTDLEEFSVELNADMETVKNILGENKARDNGYEPQATADPYYANPEDAIYPKVKSIALERLTGDKCKTRILEVIIEDTEAATHEAYVEDVIIKPQSYGGDTVGVNIPFDVYFDGKRKKGTVKITDGVPEFTPSAS